MNTVSVDLSVQKIAINKRIVCNEGHIKKVTSIVESLNRFIFPYSIFEIQPLTAENFLEMNVNDLLLTNINQMEGDEITLLKPLIISAREKNYVHHYVIGCATPYTLKSQNEITEYHSLDNSESLNHLAFIASSDEGYKFHFPRNNEYEKYAHADISDDTFILKARHIDSFTNAESIISIMDMFTLYYLNGLGLITKEQVNQAIIQRSPNEPTEIILN